MSWRSPICTRMKSAIEWKNWPAPTRRASHICYRAGAGRIALRLRAELSEGIDDDYLEPSGAISARVHGPSDQPGCDAVARDCRLRGSCSLLPGYRMGA